MPRVRHSWASLLTYSLTHALTHSLTHTSYTVLVPLHLNEVQMLCSANKNIQVLALVIFFQSYLYIFFSSHIEPDKNEVVLCLIHAVPSCHLCTDWLGSSYSSFKTGVLFHLWEAFLVSWVRGSFLQLLCSPFLYHITYCGLL